MSFFELSFKIVLSLFALLIFALAIRWLWTNQVDPVETIKKLFKGKAEAQVEWIATRDENAIYQDSKIVGKVWGEVEFLDGTLTFIKLHETTNLNQKLPFEYQRYRLRITKIEGSIGMDINMIDGKTTTLNNVLTNVECVIVK